MALTPASILADYTSGIGTQGATLKVNTSDKRIGIGTTNPQGTLQVGTGITMGSGIITATAADFSGNVTAATGTFSGNVSVGGVLTYEDVTSVDSIGVITARNGIVVSGGATVVGLSTFTKIAIGATSGLWLGYPALAPNLHVHSNRPETGNACGISFGPDPHGAGPRHAHLVWQANNQASFWVFGGSLQLAAEQGVGLGNNVGIGTTSSPGSERLHVVGDSKFVGIVTSKSLDLDAIATSKSDTAVDVFVYDTRKDSDGGAWRKRTQNTSWYNEEAAAGVRGSRKEFPAVAVIVAETNKLTIYDGDDPDLPLWMAFNLLGSVGGNSNMLPRGGSGTESDITSIACLNGRLVVGLKDVSGTVGEGLVVIDFISELARVHRTSGSGYTGAIYNLSISGRNSNGLYSGDYNTLAIAHETINDVAMTVLPNAPVDSATGLPIPTIAVATDGTASVINDDGTVVDYGAFSPIKKVAIDSKYVYVYARSEPNDYIFKTTFLSSDANYNVNITAGSGGFYVNSIGAPVSPLLKNMNATGTVVAKDHTYIRSGNDGIEIFDGNVITVDADTAIIPIAYITSDYNTGYMVGDIKGAFLSDTDIEDGVELVSNGTFNTDTTGWTVVGGGSATISSGQVQITNNGTTNCSLDQTVTTVVGKTYEISATISPQGGGPMPRLYVGNKWVQVGNSANVQQTLTLLYTARSTSTIVSINANTNVNNAVTLADNVTMKLTNDIISDNLVTNGTFDSNTNGWTAYHSVISVDSNRLRVDDTAGAGGWSAAVYEVATVIGKTYQFTFTYTFSSDTFLAGHYAGSYASAGAGTAPTSYTDYGTTSGTYIRFITATSTTTSLVFAVNNNGVSFLDNVSFKLTEEDRSVNNNPLQVFGTLTKSVVATGADLVAYSGFSASNNLVQPYNSDLNFGTGDFCFVAWIKKTSLSTNHYVLDRNDGSTESDRFSFMINSAGNINIYSGATNAQAEAAGIFVGSSAWRMVMAKRSGGVITFGLDGKEYTSTTTVGNWRTTNLTGSGNENLFIGQFGGGGTPGNVVYNNDYGIGEIANVRLSASAPSPEQFKKMYEDEKHLYQENVKCTLHGSSDAVTALAYDDTTELLHVGTSAGRSEFQGLRRINNTTTAVTTAISVSNDLVAEQ